jgi:hypothetical protein
MTAARLPPDCRPAPLTDSRPPLVGAAVTQSLAATPLAPERTAAQRQRVRITSPDGRQTLTMSLRLADTWIAQGWRAVEAREAR